MVRSCMHIRTFQLGDYRYEFHESLHEKLCLIFMLVLILLPAGQILTLL
jgi:hypothetical protein